MTDPLSPEDAEDPLVEKLAYGIELEEQTINDVRTTFPLKWADEYEKAIQSIGKDARFRSRTMCEMVISREARKQFQELRGATYTSWGTDLMMFIMCIDNDSDYYNIYKTKMEGAEKALSTINLGIHSEGEEYIHSATKEDINKLRYNGSKDGMFPWKKLQIGVALVVKDNQDLFPPNLVSNSEHIVTRVKSQYQSLRQNAIMYAIEAGRVIKSAKQEGDIYESELEKRMESIKSDDEKDDKLHRAIEQGMSESDNVIDLSDSR